jgi:hypothetical protein
VLEEYPNDYIVACIVAHAHIDVGWAWQRVGCGNPAAQPRCL